jgi:branched-chain amino acid transport system substrate-binding protein
MLWQKKSVLLIIGLLALSFVLVACAAPPAPAEEPAEEPMEEPAEEPAEEPMEEPAEEPAEEPMEEPAGGEVIRVYAAWPLQGSMLPIGEGMRNAANLALKDYLAENPDGPGGNTVEIVFNDDASPVTGSWDGTVEAEIAQKCVNDPLCLAYFGTYNSGAAAVSSPITNEAGIAQITPANTNPGLTFACPTCGEGEPDIYRPSGEQTYFRTNGNDYFQGLAGASWAQCLGNDTVFILDDRQLYGKGVADAFEAHAAEIGLDVAAHEGVESTDIDFRTLMGNIQASGATLVYGGFVIDSGGVQVVQQMANQGLFDAGIKFMGPDGLVDAALIEQVGGTDVIGDGNVLLTFPGLAPTQVRDLSDKGALFYDSYVAEYGSDPDAWDAYAYQSTLIILDSIERAAAQGEVTRASILAAMKETNFDGLTGNIQFDENGDPVVTQMGGLEVRGGEIVPLSPISGVMHEDCP